MKLQFSTVLGILAVSLAVAVLGFQLYPFSGADVVAGLSLAAAAPGVSLEAAMQGIRDLRADWDKFSNSHKELQDKVFNLSGETRDLAERLGSLALEGGGGSRASNAATEARIFALIKGRDIDAEAYGEYRDGLGNYMRRGPDALSAEVKAALTAGADPEGGYTLTPDMSGRVITRALDFAPMRRLATIQQSQSDVVEGFNDLGEASQGWVSETGTRNDTDAPQVGKWSIAVHEQYAMPKTTQKLLDDSTWNIDAWLVDKVGKSFGRQEGICHFTGNGVGKPRGILDYPTSTNGDSTRTWGEIQYVPTGVNGAFAGTDPGDDLIDLVSTLNEAYLPNARWLMNRTTAAAVMKLKDGQGNYLWQRNIIDGQPNLLLGYPVVFADAMPEITTGSMSIAFGDFREGYQIVDRLGIRVLRDPYTQKGFVKFYCYRRTGGGVVNFDAIKLLKFATS